jgi:hypothetical protein
VKIVLGALGAFLVIALAVLGWLGALSPVAVVEREMGPYQFVYVQEASADPAKIGQLTHALAERLDAAGIAARKPAQEYSPAGRGMQNQVGFMVEQSVNRDVLGTETYFRPIPAQRYMVVSFPFRNRLSFAVAQLRVGAAFEAHRQQQKYAATSTMVILEGDRILYLEPIAPA